MSEILEARRPGQADLAEVPGGHTNINKIDNKLTRRKTNKVKVIG